jgi:predicted ATPase/class 3 adenylate cyclase
MSRELPSGTVTFVFTDVEGSTRLLGELGEEGYAAALAEHRRIVREQVAAHGGVEVDTQGDAFFVAFPTAPAAVEAAAGARDALSGGPIRIRVGVHTGTPRLTDEGYVGYDVHRAARIAAVGYGGQVLVSGATAALLGGEGLRDLGAHRLKDLSAPERIYQLGDGVFPPLRSLHRTNLPIPSTPFLGRERELGEVLRLLARDDVRLLTLTGPGGTGKTRLGAQAAGAIADAYPQGVWWIPLAALRDPALVLETAAQVLGAQDALSQHIADRSMLLLFDNVEHVIGAAGEIGSLLASCPNLDVLVTSREPLHLAGEQEYAVPPFVHQEGVGFFLARARAVVPDFEVDDAVPEICERLDELPLALELAAARVKALSTRQILERLEQRLPLLTGGARDLPERQRTLRATIEWSYELLTPEEKRLLARLAVFRGGCVLDAAEGVASADVDTLQSLVDKSLLRHTRDRFAMLETIREYAAEQLAQSAEAAAIERRHAEFFVAFAEETEPRIRADPRESLERLSPEHDNFRAALDWLTSARETQLVLRLAGALQRFWYHRGHLAEARRRLEDALAADTDPTPARAYAAHGAALMALELGDIPATRRWAEEALAIAGDLGEAWLTALSTLMLAQVLREERDLERAHALYADAEREFVRLGDEHAALIAAFNVAWMTEELGDRERALQLHEENLHRARAASNPRMESVTLYNIAGAARDEGRFRDAMEMMDEAYRIVRDLGDSEVADSISRLASLLSHAGKAEDAIRVLAASEALREELGARRSWVLRRNEDTLARVRSQLDQAAFTEAWEQGRKLTADEAATIARAAIASADP